MTLKTETMWSLPFRFWRCQKWIILWTVILCVAYVCFLQDGCTTCFYDTRTPKSAELVQTNTTTSLLPQTVGVPVEQIIKGSEVDNAGVKAETAESTEPIKTDSSVHLNKYDKAYTSLNRNAANITGLPSESLQLEISRKTATSAERPPHFQHTDHPEDNRSTTNATVPPPYFQRIGTSEIWVYSAYYDHVSAQQGRPCVRGQILMSQANVRLRQFITCNFYQNGEIRKTEVSRLWPYLDTHGTPYVPGFLECALGKHMRPEFVSFTINFTTPTNRLPVLYPQPRTRNLTVCYGVMHSRFDRVSQLIQSIEINRVLGATHFIVYNYSVDPDVDFVFRHYQKEGLLSVYQWPLPITNTWYYAQVLAINDCLFRNRNASKFVVVVDTDEIIVPYVHNSWMDLIGSYQTREKNTISTFLFQSTFFSQNSKKDLDRLPTELSYTSQEKRVIHKFGLNMMSEIWHSQIIYPVQVRSKFIVRPECTNGSIIHFPTFFTAKFVIVNVPTKTAMVHHYRRNEENMTIANTNLIRFKDTLFKGLIERCFKLPSFCQPYNATV